MPYIPALRKPLHTVIETHAFRASAKAENMSESEIAEAVGTVSADPTAGDLIKGSGGCRKVRVARHGSGKSGGYRVVTYFLGAGREVILLAVLAKASRANFTNAEVQAMARVTAQLKTAAKRPAPDS
ncbi:MAG TPA: type II toxin-antitoxin system RelE/ParE family toxin [Caulobacteraceae bacterium]|jgi:hypothetical protein|nr:type II toxin-antitoxin system RelE/ParE family toxin [Caulobacteraceae bacterium]